MQSYGTFSFYEKKSKPGDPPFFERIKWLKNSSGVDWYEFQKRLSTSGTYLLLDEDDLVMSAETDVSRIFPAIGELVHIAASHDNPHSLIGKVFDRSREKFSDIPEMVLSVTAAQAEIQLLDEPDPDGEFESLFDRIEHLALNHPVKAVGAYFRRATVWERYNPYIQGIALEIWSDPALAETKMTTLFERASRR